MGDLTNAIDQALDLARPDRYSSREKSWLDAVITGFEPVIPPMEARRIAARELVHRREEMACRAANRLLRDIAEHGQPPLDWMDLARRPLAWDQHRVCLEECTPSDFRDWADVEESRAKGDYDTRMASVDAARWLADQMDVTAAQHITELWSD